MERRRSPLRNASTSLLRIGDCVLNLATRECQLHGKPVKVRKVVFDLLCLLIERRPVTVSREELLRKFRKGTSTSSAVIARAVLEARRAIGDDLNEPRLIVNLHGVGYRFAGTVEAVATHSATPLQTTDSNPVNHVRSLLEEAEVAYDRGDGMETSRARAEAALGLALQNGLNVERGRAVCWLGWLSMWTERPEAAANHVGLAMQIATVEGNNALLAQVQVLDAFLRFMLGDTDHAMKQLTAAYGTLSTSPLARDRQRCENLLASVARQLRQWDVALYWSEKARQTAIGAGLRTAQLRAEANAITLILGLGDEHERNGSHFEARIQWERALASCDELLSQVHRAQSTWLWTSVVGNRGATLGRLGRFSEADAALVEVGKVLDAMPNARSPGVQERIITLRIERIRLLLRQGQLLEALPLVEAGLLEVEAAGVRTVEPDLCELGSSIAERCGRLSLALRWSRRQVEALRGLDEQRTQRLIRVMQAESLQTELRRELEGARRQVILLERQVADLLGRVSAT